MKITRRGFLKLLGLGAAAPAVASLPAAAAAAPLAAAAPAVAPASILTGAAVFIAGMFSSPSMTFEEALEGRHSSALRLDVSARLTGDAAQLPKVGDTVDFDWLESIGASISPELKAAHPDLSLVVESVRLYEKDVDIGLCAAWPGEVKA